MNAKTSSVRMRALKMAGRGDCPELEGVAVCVESFAQMMANLDGHRLPDRLKQAEATGFPSLKGLVNGIRQDFDAITAGLTLEWNSGRVEGNVKRIKRTVHHHMSAAIRDVKETA